ncbi:WhiB family transcriptional regulator [Labedaea rhizosphaerae]|uniref:Transcription factor WhiB n=1 Tax=Labedaea rhizosphaerae TaxID=598644 RepID=A0A4R6RW24_LABRH|nr:WhiB family transcriptional regulator [Labedaea rhizosphaerae]TDP90525.1 transcription factor WhiB [Labedaea rhizosphaerae]
MTVTEYPRLPRAIPSWHGEAACRLFPELADLWHDAKAKSAEDLAVRLICAGCPVRFQCAVGALERGEAYGIWGGLDRRDRKAIALKYGYPIPAVVPEHGSDARYKKHGCRCPECKDGHARYEAERRQLVRERGNVWRKRTPAVPVACSPIHAPTTRSSRSIRRRLDRCGRAHARARRARRAHAR